MDTYCTIRDVTDRLTIEPDKDDKRLIVAMVDEATVAVDAYLGKHFDESVPAAGPDPRKVDTSGVSYAALVSVAEFSASKTSGAE
ncbi:MAG: hypothetical protein E6Y04_09820, partial [Corynebacterium sp.]|nr:hypothetical protein [Corynebacterium sp.]